MSSHGKDRSPAQHQWQTRAGSILDSDLFAARRKWCIRCPPAIKNGQSPLMPVVASLNLTGPAAEDTSTPVSKATQRSRQLGACPRPALLDCHCMFLSKHRMTAIGKAPLFSGTTRPKNMNFNISYYLLFLTYQLLPILPRPTANRKKCLILHLALRPIGRSC